MISIKHNFLFIHYPKTGGNSIQNNLINFSDDNKVCLAEHQDGVERFEIRNNNLNINKHSGLLDYKAQLSEGVYKSLFKFSTVRNPWDRMISFYFSPHRKVSDWNRNDFIRLVKTVKPMADFVLTGESSELSDELDFIIRFENIEQDYKLVCDKLSIPCFPLVKRNASIRNSYRKYYDNELVELVKSRFIKEVRVGHYNF